MCTNPTETDRREKRVRGFLATVEEIAREAAREETAKMLAPGAIIRVPDPGRQDPAHFRVGGGPATDDGMRAENRRLRELVDHITAPGGKHLPPLAVERLRAMRLMLKAGDPKVALIILNDVMGW